MNFSRDGLLEAIIRLAEEPSPAGPPEIFHVTLTIDGMLVTGRIISRDEFMRHHVFVEKLWEKFPRPASEMPPTKRLSGAAERWFIHLADAQFSAPGQASAPPTGPGVFWRGLLSEVSGFSFARADNPSP